MKGGGGEIGKCWKERRGREIKGRGGAGGREEDWRWCVIYVVFITLYSALNMNR